MASNPNPSRISEASWWLMQQLLALERGTANGGLYAAKPGYHNTRNGNSRGNYSVLDSVDREGPADKCAALDWTFRDAQAGRYAAIAKYTNRLLKSAKDLSDPRLNGWREFYGQADADTQVEGWDTRYGRPASSDPSHLWHLHFSESRKFINDFDNKKALLSVLKGETVAEWKGDDGMELNDKIAHSSVTKSVPYWKGEEAKTVASWMRASAYQAAMGRLEQQAQSAAIVAAVAALAKSSNLTAAEITAAAEAGARAALADVEISWSTDSE